ncbi:TPA: glycosyltransferase [Candidatus Ventrenecus avicola]|nr:glycosyltransferase [Candidatus Ventrenecus avicola]
MEKLKVVVYAISKNESKFVSRWVNSMKEADEIIVLDTGSEDNTVAKLKELGVKVYEHVFYPWRFDTARNESLSYVPKDTDICVCTDLDEVFEPGWREILEREWVKENPTRARYNFNWKLDEENRPCVNFWINKIHNRSDYHWHHPVHEILVSNKEEKEIEVPITLNHYPDATKSRGSYLPLLEISVAEEPDDDRNLHYLGREYMYYQKWDKCIETLHKHLACKNATWKDERCASMRFLGRAYEAKGYLEEAENWWQRAIEEAPYLREGYIELANLYLKEERYEEAYNIMQKASSIKEKSKSYINEEFAWNDAFYDIFSLASFYTGHYEEAINYVKKAIEINPNEERYQKNLELMMPYSFEV